jgi:hypothetical protein
VWLSCTVDELIKGKDNAPHVLTDNILKPLQKINPVLPLLFPDEIIGNKVQPEILSRGGKTLALIDLIEEHFFLFEMSHCERDIRQSDFTG